MGKGKGVAAVVASAEPPAAHELLSVDDFGREAAAMAWMNSHIHGITHWSQVHHNGTQLALKSGLGAREVRLVQAFALTHDLARLTDGHDRGAHARAGSKLFLLKGRYMFTEAPKAMSLKNSTAVREAAIARHSTTTSSTKKRGDQGRFRKGVKPEGGLVRNEDEPRAEWVSILGGDLEHSVVARAIHHHTDGKTFTGGDKAGWFKDIKAAVDETGDDLNWQAVISCCWDADRLDLVRVGMTPKEQYMSTAVWKTVYYENKEFFEAARKELAQGRKSVLKGPMSQVMRAIRSEEAQRFKKDSKKAKEAARVLAKSGRDSGDGSGSYIEGERAPPTKKPHVKRE